MQKTNLAAKEERAGPSKPGLGIALSDIENPLIQKALALWENARGARTMPSRATMSPRVMAGLLRNAALVRVIGSGEEFELRIVGDVVVQAQGASLQGMTTAEIDLVRQDTRGVTIRLASHPLTEYRSPSIDREVPTATRELPSAALSVPGGGSISVEPADEKQVKAVEMLFQLDLALPDGVTAERLGELVYVRLDHSGRTLAWRIAREVRQVFLRRFDL